MTELTWDDFDEWWIQRGTTGNDYFHSGPDCERIKNPEKAQKRSENFVAFHEPAPCEYCHPEVGALTPSVDDVELSSGETTIFEMRKIARDDVLQQSVKMLITPDRVERYPHRDYDVLKRVLEEYDHPDHMAKALGSDHKTVRRWAAVYGLDYPGQLPETLRWQRKQSAGDD